VVRAELAVVEECLSRLERFYDEQSAVRSRVMQSIPGETAALRH
jgi:hypothetical protein